MSAGTVSVRGIPVTEEQDTDYIVECSECGPIGPATGDEVHLICIDHLETHGVDVTPWKGE
jgi:hypothetical protein